MLYKRGKMGVKPVERNYKKAEIVAPIRGVQKAFARVMAKAIGFRVNGKAVEKPVEIVEVKKTEKKAKAKPVAKKKVYLVDVK